MAERRRTGFAAGVCASSLVLVVCSDGVCVGVAGARAVFFGRCFGCCGYCRCCCCRACCWCFPAVATHDAGACGRLSRALGVSRRALKANPAPSHSARSCASLIAAWSVTPTCCPLYSTSPLSPPGGAVLIARARRGDRHGRLGRARWGHDRSHPRASPQDERACEGLGEPSSHSCARQEGRCDRLRLSAECGSGESTSWVKNIKYKNCNRFFFC